jgi:hypothetical protein
MDLALTSNYGIIYMDLQIVLILTFVSNINVIVILFAKPLTSENDI